MKKRLSKTSSSCVTQNKSNNSNTPTTAKNTKTILVKTSSSVSTIQIQILRQKCLLIKFRDKATANNIFTFLTIFMKQQLLYNYLDSHHSQGGMQFATQNSPPLNWKLFILITYQNETKCPFSHCFVSIFRNWKFLLSLMDQNEYQPRFAQVCTDMN